MMSEDKMNSYDLNLPVNGLHHTTSCYQLTASDENCNVEIDDSYDDLDAECKVNRKFVTSSRQKYADLDPAAMGVGIGLESMPLLTENIEKNENEELSGCLKESQEALNKDYTSLDTNYNKELSEISNLLDNVTLVSENNFYSTFHSDDDCNVFSQASSALNITDKSSSSKILSGSKSDNIGFLPIGWEKHEDDSGPYYWHISSGTIQRDPPLSLNLSRQDVSTFHYDTSCRNSIFNDMSHGHDFECQTVTNTKRKSCPIGGSCSLTADKQPIRFAVQSLGWLEISEMDLTPERSSKAVNKCIVHLSGGRNDILDVVGRWGDGKDLFMDLDDYSLCLIDIQDLSILNTQPIHTIRVWGVGRDNGRDFAYVARDQTTKQFMCHVFRCDLPARIIANTLRDICKKIMIERSLQGSYNKDKESLTSREKTKLEATNAIVTRPTNLSMEQHIFSSELVEMFPTPMDEPKKILKAYYLGSTNVQKATGMEILNNAIEKLSSSLKITDFKLVHIAVAPSTITVTEPGKNETILAECRVRFLSFLGIGKDVKYCGIIVHTALNEFIAHIFYCEPSSGALCKTIEAACKLRYQKCLDAHGQNVDYKECDEQKKGIKTALKNVFGTFFSTRSKRCVET